MSWLAIGNGRRALKQPESDRSTEAIVSVGSLVVEASVSGEHDLSQTLIHLQRNEGWDRGFCMTLQETGELVVKHRQNKALTCAHLQLRRPDRDAVLRITYSWDGPRRQGFLTAENLETGGMDQTVFRDPQPWPINDIAVLCGGGKDVQLDPGVSLLAVSDKVESVGLAVGLVTGTLIETGTGPKKVEDLVPGDMVLTAEHGMQPVRWAISREVPAIGGFAPIRLSSPNFGMGREMSVAPDHRILIHGADAEYLFGTDAVMVEARYLASMAPLTPKPHGGTVTYVQLILDSHDCVLASGCWVESLYLGNLPDNPVRLATAGLGDVPADYLPRHTRIANPLLKPYEAVVLVSAMCA